MPNPIVFFDITADGAPLGRVEMEVRYAYCLISTGTT